MIPGLIKVKDVPMYVYSRTGILPSLWKVKRWIAAGWIPLLRPADHDCRYHWTTKSLVDKFIKEHKKPEPEPKLAKECYITIGWRE